MKAVLLILPLFAGVLACCTSPLAQARNTQALATTNETASQVAIGDDHSCALTSTGGVKCWGSNQYKQLGDGSTTDSDTPVDVANIANSALEIAVGAVHSCALTTTGGVKCWGVNNHGQLGDDTTSYRSIPVDVVGLTDVVAIAAAHYHTCALTASGGVKCWGNNSFGQLGDGTTTDRHTPVDVSGLASGVVAIAPGKRHTCALTATGVTKCWGYNGDGELGDGTTTARHTPTNVTGLGNNIVDVKAGAAHTCVLDQNGAVKCWGLSLYGEIGDGTASVDPNPVPVAVTVVGSAVQSIAPGAFYTCVVTTQHGAKCWGMGGQLGNGSTSNSTTAVDVVGLTGNAEMVATGKSHSCAVTVAGGVKCWGHNPHGELGNGHHGNNSYSPVDVVGLSAPDLIFSNGFESQ